MLADIFNELRRKLPRLTHARKCVVRCLYEADAPLTAQELHGRIGDDSIDTATVYRNLETLSGLGIVHKVEHSQHGLRFALKGATHSHAIECEKCKSRRDIGECFMQEVEELIFERTGFRNIHHIVNFSGVCPSCQQKM